MTKKGNQAEKVYHEALEFLDGVHGALAELAELSGIDTEREPIVSDENAHFPKTQFVIAGVDDPERGGLALDTRMTLSLTSEHAETLLFEILRALREEEKEIELDLDGRFMVKRSAAGDIKRALDE